MITEARLRCDYTVNLVVRSLPWPKLSMLRKENLTLQVKLSQRSWANLNLPFQVFPQ